MLQALHIYILKNIKNTYVQKKTLFSLSFGELFAHADPVWDFLIINLIVFSVLHRY